MNDTHITKRRGLQITNLVQWPWKTSNTNGDWSWSNIRNINYQLNQILTKEAGGVMVLDTNIRQYCEIYFMRAYCYFDLLKNSEIFPQLQLRWQMMRLSLSQQTNVNLVMRWPALLLMILIQQLPI